LHGHSTASWRKTQTISSLRARVPGLAQKAAENIFDNLLGRPDALGNLFVGYPAQVRTRTFRFRL